MHVKTECVNTDDEVNYILQLCEGPIDKQVKTRPDTRQSSRGWLGRSSSAKTRRNSEMLRTDGPTDRHGKV